MPSRRCAGTERAYYRVVDVEAWHVGVGRLLREVQRIKSEADRPAAQQLFEKYGIHIDTELRDEVLDRFASWISRPSPAL